MLASTSYLYWSILYAYPIISFTFATIFQQILMNVLRHQISVDWEHVQIMLMAHFMNVPVKMGLCSLRLAILAPSLVLVCCHFF